MNEQGDGVDMVDNWKKRGSSSCDLDGILENQKCAEVKLNREIVPSSELKSASLEV